MFDAYELKQRLLELFRSPTYKPPLLPGVALELLELTRRRQTNASDLVNLLGRDPVLAGQVLSLASSALHSRGAPIRSLDDAVVRLGQSRITELFMQVSLEAKVFRAPGYSEPMDRLRRHSVFTAEASRLISQATSGLNEYAFLCGLLHDVGIAACILALSGPLRDRAPSDFSEAWPVVEETHAGSSELLAKIWGLPPDVALVLGLHDQPLSQGRVHPLAAAIHTANCYAERAGLGFLSDGNAARFRPAAAQLGMTEPALVTLERSLAKLAEQLGGSELAG